MNKIQTEIVELRLKREEKTLKELKQVYVKALHQIESRLRSLMLDVETQSKMYQIQYQKALKKQISEILDKMNKGTYKTIDEYLKGCYENGFFETLYDLQSQGVPLIFPINQNAMAKSISNSTKLSETLYKKLGISTSNLNKTIAMEITQGIATDINYFQIASRINKQMGTGLYNAERIARTEGHRIQSESTYDCIKKASDNGADIVMQWDSTMDKKTRPTHMALNGQIRKVGEEFETETADGQVRRALYPSGFGIAEEDINCRCVLLERAKWSLEDDGNYSKWDGDNGVLIQDLSDSKDYEEFKERLNEYL